MRIPWSSLGLAVLLAATAVSAHAEIAIIVNPANPATRMFPSQAAQFFMGSSTMFAPVEQAESAPIRAEFYRKVLEKEPAQVQAMWSKLVFTGKAKAPREYKSGAEVKKAVAENPKAIGYIDKSEVDGTVKVVALVP
jgi:ABC-type phosphate transport system substrate-binding protein